MTNLTIGSQTISLKVENGKAFATSLDIAKAFDKRHADIIRKLERLVSFEYFCSQRKIALAKYTDEQGKERKMYQLDRDIFLMITLTLKGAKAEQYRLDFIKAFNLLEEEYFKTQKKLTCDDDMSYTLEHTLPYAPKDTISKVNGLKRDKLVRSYYRSKNGKEIKRLDILIADIKTSLFADTGLLEEYQTKRDLLIKERDKFISSQL